MSSKRIRVSDELLRHIKTGVGREREPMSLLSAVGWIEALRSPAAAEAACGAIGLDSGSRVEVIDALDRAVGVLHWMLTNEERVKLALQVFKAIEAAHPQQRAAQALALVGRING